MVLDPFFHYTNLALHWDNVGSPMFRQILQGMGMVLKDRRARNPEAVDVMQAILARLHASDITDVDEFIMWVSGFGMASSSAPRRSSRLIQANLAEAGSASTRPAAVARKPSRKRAKPTEDPDIVELRSIAHKVDSNAFSEHWPEFLQKLQAALDLHQPGLVKVWHDTIIWFDSDNYQKNLKWQRIPFDSARTLSRWVNSDSSAQHQHQYSLVVMTTPPFLPGKDNREDWNRKPYHMWALLTHHAPEGSQQKTIITFDSDVEPRHNDARQSTSLGMELRYVKYIRKKPGRSRDRLWQNLPIPGAQPASGECFPVTIRFLLGLVKNGLKGRHLSGTGLVELDGFALIHA
ncbi:hypothetical protein B0H13DRAFT_2325959 [Mycena leptocephala]|nr:hypothetical protein B0H13DRAFT_2325959 [Mycena leptocephala]